ncbi:MAG: hypothetical protein Kow0075_01000 [Salibacteraceae bacterium]
MNKTLMALALTVCTSATVFGQVSKRTGNEDTLRTVVPTVFRYKPTISDAKKLREQPRPIETDVTKPQPQYELMARPLQVVYVPDSIRPAKMKGEPLDPLYKGYIKAGIGNGINYLGDLYFNSGRSRSGEIGFESHNYGTQGVIVGVPPAPYLRSTTSFYGKHFFKRHALSGIAYYDAERLQYYGYDDSNPFYFGITQTDPFRQVYHRAGGQVEYQSFFTDSSQLNYTASLKIDRFQDASNANSDFWLRPRVRFSKFIAEHKGILDLSGDLNFIQYPDSFTSVFFKTVPDRVSSHIITIAPQMRSTFGKFGLAYGFNAQALITSGGVKPRLYPNIHARYNLLSEVIIPYLSITGGLQRNNLNTLAATNPFIWPSLALLRNTDRVLHLSGGFRGSISRSLTYNLSAGRYTDRDVPLFVNYNASSYNPGLNRFGENYFTVIYDTIQTTEISGELTYNVQEKIEVVASGTFRSFKTTREVKAWQLPSVEARLSAFYQLQHKIIVKADFMVYGPRYAKSLAAYNPGVDNADDTEFINGTPYAVRAITLKTIADINLGVEYRYTERLSAFLNINNLIAQRYAYWNQYPVQRINILAGLTYSFARQ